MASGRLPPRRVAPLQRHRTGDAHACFPAGPHQRDVSEKWLRRGRRQARVSRGAAWPRAARLTPPASGRARATSGWPRPAPGSCRASPAPVGTFRDLGLCPDVAPPRPLFSVYLARGGSFSALRVRSGARAEGQEGPARASSGPSPTAVSRCWEVAEPVTFTAAGRLYGEALAPQVVCHVYPEPLQQGLLSLKPFLGQNKPIMRNAVLESPRR